MAQLQCPHCGGYRVTKFDKGNLWGNIFWATFLGLIIFGVGEFFLVPYAISDYVKKSKDPWYQYGYRCDLCGYEWLQKPGETVPVNVDPDLIAKGGQALEEQRRRRERDEWRGQQMMNK